MNGPRFIVHVFFNEYDFNATDYDLNWADGKCYRILVSKCRNSGFAVLFSNSRRARRGSLSVSLIRKNHDFWNYKSSMVINTNENNLGNYLAGTSACLFEKSKACKSL